MLKIVALFGVSAACLCAPAASFAASNLSTGYGTEGAGPIAYARPLSTWERYANRNNEAQMRAVDSAEWVRQHSQRFPLF